MYKSKINVVVAGATGYVGLDLINLLSKHPNVKLKNLCAQKSVGKKINIFDKRIKKNLPKISKISSVKWENIDILFLSLPNGEAQKLINKLFYKHQNLRFIDLSADFRLKNINQYKNYYKKKHKAKKLIKESIYSITEFKKKELKQFRIIANPGCYPTSIQIPLIPLLKKRLIRLKNIIIDSKSGYSGAGKNYKNKFKFKNFIHSTYAYSVNNHRHVAEIDQEFRKISKKIVFTFNPHLIPTFRGILSSIYISKKNSISINKIIKTLKDFYRNDPFIKINKPNSQMGTGNVLNTNLCELSICQSKIKDRIVIFSAIDNLIKGAAGQAIQNMNVMFNLSQRKGLK
tara:strand:+ start:328 stop:1359 length:1032 start_codon:yes stop_codon:yes gene_type:complete